MNIWKYVFGPESYLCDLLNLMARWRENEFVFGRRLSIVITGSTEDDRFEGACYLLPQDIERGEQAYFPKEERIGEVFGPYDCLTDLFSALAGWSENHPGASDVHTLQYQDGNGRYCAEVYYKPETA